MFIIFFYLSAEVYLCYCSHFKCTIGVSCVYLSRCCSSIPDLLGVGVGASIRVDAEIILSVCFNSSMFIVNNNSKITHL